jgi:hypothetical protein
MNRKGFFNQKIMTYTIGLLIIVLVILLFVKYRSNLESKKKEASYLIVDEKIKAVTETLLYGQVDKAVFDVPLGTKVCFIDSRPQKRSWLANSNTPLIRKYPVITDILSSDVDRNVIYIDMDSNEVIKSRWVKDICFDAEPYYVCIDSVDGELEVWFEGKGKCTNVWSSLRSVASRNKKNADMYEENQLFLAQDYDEQHRNWPNILSLVPLALWSTGTSEQIKYPYSIFYKNEDIEDIDNEDIISVMDNYGVSVSYIMGDSPVAIPDGQIGDTSYYLYKITIDDYFKFWETYEYVVVSPMENKAIAFKTALAGSAMNAPVIFVDDDNIGDYLSYVEGRYVWIFDKVSLSDEVIEDIASVSLDTPVDAQLSEEEILEELYNPDTPNAISSIIRKVD